MRKASRLDAFYDELKVVHKEYFCDQRFGQFMSNFFGWLATEKQKDLFFLEENEMIEYIKEYAKKVSIWKRD